MCTIPPDKIVALLKVLARLHTYLTNVLPNQSCFIYMCRFCSERMQQQKVNIL